MSTIAQATNRAHRRYGFLWAMVDFLTALNAFLLLVNLLIFISIVNQPETVTEGLSLNAEFIAIMSWPPDVDCDVDIWVRNPMGSVISFKYKDLDHMSIDRDDMGKTTDIVQGVDSPIIVNDNREYVTFRKMFEGNYTINVHLYSCRMGGIPLKAGTEIAPFLVNLELMDVNPTMTTVFKTDVEFTKTWYEQTFLNFYIDSEGNYKYIDNTPRKIVVVG